ncbi:MAG TPA: nuclear transport factor 2 family protein [Ktedonobacterales bacterium]|nr:nuclear transport factor 2 family protein [Ktedonobacterales bacterium]
MSTATVDLTTLSNAIEAGDEAAIVAFYADDAELTIVDRNRPPSKPTLLTGKSAIGEYYHDVCSRAMTHKVEQPIVGSDGIAFTEACRYPDGVRVLSANLLALRDGKIARHTLVQAWDE